jgi:hypothetical protein
LRLLRKPKAFWISDATSTYFLLSDDHQVIFSLYLLLLTAATLRARYWHFMAGYTTLMGMSILQFERRLTYYAFRLMPKCAENATENHKWNEPADCLS